MNVSLTPELEKLVADKVKSGMYQTASEVVREALRALEVQEAAKLERLRQDIRAGIEALERGKFVEYDERTLKNLTRDVAARGRRRLRPSRRAPGP